MIHLRWVSGDRLANPEWACRLGSDLGTFRGGLEYFGVVEWLFMRCRGVATATGCRLRRLSALIHVRCLLGGLSVSMGHSSCHKVLLRVFFRSSITMPQKSGCYVQKIPLNFSGIIYPTNLVRLSYADLENSIARLLDPIARETSRENRLSHLRDLGIAISGSRNGDVLFDRVMGLSSAQISLRAFSLSRLVLSAPFRHGMSEDISIVVDGSLFEPSTGVLLPPRRYRIPLVIVERVLAGETFPEQSYFQPWNPGHVVLGVLQVGNIELGGDRRDVRAPPSTSKRRRSFP